MIPANYINSWKKQHSWRRAGKQDLGLFWGTKVILFSSPIVRDTSDTGNRRSNVENLSFVDFLICRTVGNPYFCAMNILIVSSIAFIINVFLGRWRIKYQKFTFKWWLLIHASIPLIIPLRIWLDTPTICIPLFIGLAVAGQFVGSRMRPDIGNFHTFARYFNECKKMKIISSYITTVILLIVYATVLAGATFVEKYYGTHIAQKTVYYSPLFFLLQFCMVVNLIAIIVERRLLKRRKWGFLMLHSAFVVILLGAFISYLFSVEGILHIREGETTNKMSVLTPKGHENYVLPFEVKLLQFILSRYPGSASPSSFESKVLVYVDGETREERIFMNNVLDIKGYRFFQSSYDSDELGTILSVKKDVAGRNVTYAGYILLTFGFIFCLFGRDSRFRQLNRRLKELRTKSMTSATVILLILAFLLSTPSKAQQSMSEAMQNSSAKESEKRRQMWEAVQKFALTIPKEHIEKFGALPLLSSNGRVMPVNTFSSEILRKVHKSTRIWQFDSDRFLLSVLALPEMWARIPVIALPNEDLAMFFNLSPKQCAYIDMFDENGKYKLQDKLETAYNKPPAERNRFDKDLMKLDEQVNIMYQIFNYQLLNLFPKENDPEQRWYASGDDLSSFSGQDSAFVASAIIWYSETLQHGMKTGEWIEADHILDLIATYQQKRNNTVTINPKRLAAEIRYNKMDFFRWSKIGYLSLGGLLLVVAFLQMFHRRTWQTKVIFALIAGVAAVFVYHTVGIAIRWYIAGRAPWSNSYETMVYVAWAMIVAGVMFARRSAIAFALATLFAGIVLFVSSLNWMDPEISPLAPVLKSPWLMFHVAVIVAAYGFMGISCLIGLTNLVILSLRTKNRQIIDRIKELSIINEMSVITGLALMTVGTFLGAVWANVSWGRYWGWDAKETWALVTVIVYALVIHLRLIKRCDNVWLFNLVSVIAFAAVLMTYFGVNYFLSGMHSYGQTGSMDNVFAYMLPIIFIIILLAFTSFYGGRKRNLFTHVSQSYNS
jgi:cytochrome c-type biogenesis protein CcsB